MDAIFVPKVMKDDEATWYWLIAMLRWDFYHACLCPKHFNAN